MTTHPKQSDIDLLIRLIDLRDSAHLAGHTDDLFQFVEVNGPESVLFSPGRTEGTTVSEVGIRRLDELGLLHVYAANPAGGFTFDLEDDARDRLEELRVAIGQPSRLGEAEAARNRAETALRDNQGKARLDAAARAELRTRYAVRIGRRVRRVVTAVLLVLYVGVIVLAGYFVSANLPIALIVGVVTVGIVLTVLDWLFHFDGFGIAAAVERRAVDRIARWLESFDVE